MIKYLDDEIFANMQISPHDNVNGQYFVYQFNRWDGTDSEGIGGIYDLIFVGNVFIESTQSLLSIYMNDIIESRKPAYKALDVNNHQLTEINNYQMSRTEYEAQYTRYRVELILQNGFRASDEFDVYLAYHYPQYNYQEDMIGLPEIYDDTESLMLLREGYDVYMNESTLIPRIPYTTDSYFAFGAYFMPSYKRINRYHYVDFDINEGDKKINTFMQYATTKYYPQFNMFKNPYVNVDWVYYTYEQQERWTIEYVGSHKGEAETVKYLVDTFGISEEEAYRIFGKGEALLLVDLTDEEMANWFNKLEGDGVIIFTSYSRTVTVQVEHVRDTNNINITMQGIKRSNGYKVVQESIGEDVDRDDYIRSFLMDVCHHTEADAQEIWHKLEYDGWAEVYLTDTIEDAQRVYAEAMNYGDAVIDNAYIYESANVRIANVDYCPSRYYLMWHDRFGGLQCQPFDCPHTFTEKITNTYIQNQYNQKRNGVVEVEPSWKLVSKWIPEVQYACYESIFTSPKVILVDTQSKVCHNVLVSDTNYTEKTRKNNNRQLINFTINVKEYKNQRMVY